MMRQLSLPSDRPRADVVIVGSGPVGATFAREIAEQHPTATILMVEVGPILGDPAGANVKNTSDLEVRAEQQRRSQGPTQRSYSVPSLADRARANVRPDLASPDTLSRPGTFLVSSTGADTAQMPAAAMSANVGGMGAHWTCACPWPFADERTDAVADGWDDLLDRARELLGVSADAYGVNESQRALLDELERRIPGSDSTRRPQPLPMALGRGEAGMRWIGTSDILGDLVDDPRFTLIADTLCERVLMDGDTAIGVRLRSQSGEIHEIGATTVVVAADPFRTPQLLWASGVRPAGLGRALNEHAQVISGVAIDAQFAPPSHVLRGGDPVSGVVWIPYDPESFPYHGQLTSVQSAPLQIEAHPEPGSTVMTMSWFCPTELNEQNRVEFSDTALDAFGMPLPTIYFARSPEDLRRVDVAVHRQREVASHLGTLTNADGPTIMPPGSSLHYTGTTRISTVDDGRSVCDPDSRVWKTANLYVGGNGTIPTAVAGNPTLTSVAIAVRSARVIARTLATL